MITILFVSADPSNLGRLRLDKEVREIKQSLRDSKLTHRFRLELSQATRPRDFIQAMIDHNPDIVHFSGHGSDGALWLENDAGEACPASASALSLMFKRFRKRTGCVILNACSSRRQAKAIAPYAYHVIGTKREISDDAAIGFSAGFYQGLGSGDDVPDALDLGRASMEMCDSSSHGMMVLTKGSGGKPLDLRFASHLPIVIGMGCTEDAFRSMMRDALRAMKQYDFSEDLYRDYDLSREGYSIHKEEWLLADPSEWRQFAKQGTSLVDGLNRKVAGPKVYHFFIRAPICFGIGFGACLGTKHEAIIHHYQPGPSDHVYFPVINASISGAPDHGAHIVRLPTGTEPLRGSVNAGPRLNGKVYVSLAFAPSQPTGVNELAAGAGARLVQIRSSSGGNIPLTADWLHVARDLNAVLRKLIPQASEMHLFPSMPVALGFAVGMGLDTRHPVVVHQWYSPDVGYREVFRLNELGPPG
jgi:hypothetical protein